MLKPSAAPTNDLSFLKMAKSYEITNKGISRAAVEAFLRHMWYLNEALIALAFIDDGVDSSTKRKMMSGLNRQGSDDPPKRVQLDPSAIPAKELHDLVTSKTLTFFDTLCAEW